MTLPPPPRADRRAYADLAPRQQELFQTYVDNYNATRGSHYTAEEAFERLTVSEQTTFYGVTHALLHTSLTDSAVAPLWGWPSIGSRRSTGSRANTMASAETSSSASS